MLGAAAIAALLMIAGALASSFPMLLILWAAALTPSDRLLRCSAHPEDRPAVFAAQFALSHACWLLTYPLVGWLGATFGFGFAFIAMAAIGGIGVATALRVWPRSDPEIITHVHHDLVAGDPHIADAEVAPRGFRHAHAHVIDADHAAWPAR